MLRLGPLISECNDGPWIGWNWDKSSPMSFLADILNCATACRGLARVLLTAVVVLGWMSTPVRAEVIICDFSRPSSQLIMADPLDWLEIEPDQDGSRSSTSGVHDQLPSNAPDAGQLLNLRLANRDSRCFGGGATGGSNLSSGANSPVAAIGSKDCEFPTVPLMTWLRSVAFLFVPPAPRSGLMRPPKASSLLV
jgi:hypothetical protein